MHEKPTRRIVASSLVWKFAERSGVQGVQFLVQVILARLLDPQQFGSIALVMVFVNLAQVFVQSGFNTALIQKKDAEEEDFNSVFCLSLVVSFLLYLVLFLASPAIGRFYDDEVFAPALRILSLTLFFGALNSIQNAYIARNLMFKELFICSLVAVLVSGVSGVVVAYRGLGLWALVIQHLVNQVTVTLSLMYVVSWKPRTLFSRERVRALFSFGGKLLLSQLLNSLYTDLRTLVVGKMFSPAALGYYNRGQQFPSLVVSNVDGSMQAVMLPTLSAHQENRSQVKSMMRRAIKSSSFLIFPTMAGIAAVAEPLVTSVLTDKWLPCVPFIRIFCMSYALMPIHTANLQAINAVGRSDVFLKLEVIKKTLGLMVLVISLPFGIYAIAVGQVVSGILASFVNAYPNKRLLNYGYWEQWADMMPSFGLAIVMGLAVYALDGINLAVWQLLALKVGVGMIVYLGLARLLRVESYTYLREALVEMLRLSRNANA